MSARRAPLGIDLAPFLVLKTTTIPVGATGTQVTIITAVIGRNTASERHIKATIIITTLETVGGAEEEL